MTRKVAAPAMVCENCLCLPEANSRRAPCSTLAMRRAATPASNSLANANEAPELMSNKISSVRELKSRMADEALMLAVPIAWRSLSAAVTVTITNEIPQHGMRVSHPAKFIRRRASRKVNAPVPVVMIGGIMRDQEVLDLSSRDSPCAAVVARLVAIKAADVNEFLDRPGPCTARQYTLGGIQCVKNIATANILLSWGLQHLAAALTARHWQQFQAAPVNLKTRRLYTELALLVNYQIFRRGLLDGVLRSPALPLRAEAPHAAQSTDVNGA
jgi:hypothetical protein